MKFGLTIVYITAREKPMLTWLYESLSPQCLDGEPIRILVVDRKTIKPTVWQGDYRLTQDDWWAASCARNTGICLCKTEWIAFLDDRSLLTPSWLQSVRHAMDDGYAVFGAYEKVHHLKAENGFPLSFEVLPESTGKDSRETYVKTGNHPIPFDCGGEWAFGCNLALPLEWALNVGGYDETCDGLSMEDCIFGLMLQNNGYPLKYDPRMKILEDRTPSELGTPMIRRDKGVSPNDKSHALLEMLRHRKTAMHGFEIREVRRNALAGKGWPKPWGPTHDFWDGQKLEDMK